MSKILNQLLYSAVVFGSDNPSGVLRLESTSSGTKGPVELVGTQFDLISNGQIGRFIHTNTDTRTYSLPDVSGEIFVSDMFTLGNQLLYSSAVSTYAVLDPVLGGALTTNVGGDISWVMGADGQVLTIVSGAPIFQDIPDVGSVGESLLPQQLPHYAVAGNDLVPLTTEASRVLYSLVDDTLEWGLLPATYLRGVGNIPLTVGVLDQVLSSVGDGTFKWVTPTAAIIVEGDLNQLPFYSASPTGTELSASSFMATDEGVRALLFQNRGGVRFYELDVNGVAFVEFRAAADIAVSTSFSLPPADGLPDDTLVTDGSGNLSFQTPPDNGSVAVGNENDIAYYMVGGNDVSGLTTEVSRILGSTALGVPTWMLLSESYLETTGGTPLAGGTLNQVLVSDGALAFTWANAVDITGEVLSGVGNSLAYYPATGTKVDDVAFLTVGVNTLNLLLGSTLRIHEPAGAAYLELLAPTMISNLSLTLPAEDGTFEQALVTDGSGGLSFITVGRGIVHTGTTGTLSYYSADTNEVHPLTNVAGRVALTSDPANLVEWGLLTAPYLSDSSGDPLDNGTAGQLLSAVGDGNFVWYTLTASGVVTPSTSSAMTFYPYAGDTVDGSTWLMNNELLKILELHNSGRISFYEITNTNYVALRASDELTTNIELTLPAELPSDDGYVMTSEADGTMSFLPPSGDTRWEQRGVILVPPLARSVTVLYDEPFSASPAYVDVQWAIGPNDLFLPAYAIERSTEQGFIIRLSSAIPSGSYKIYWESQLVASQSVTAAVFFAGGETAGSTYLDTIRSLNVDLDTTVNIATTIASGRAYMASGGSSTKGYLFGGETAPATPTDVISSMVYSTLVTADLGVTLASTKSRATGLGTRVKSYVVGGFSGVALSSIEPFDPATETVLAVIAATLSSSAYARASATTDTIGAIVHNTGSLDLLMYATESVVVSTQNFGVTDISVGANTTDIGYFGRNTGGALSKYLFSTNTLTSLPVSLGSTAGLSMAGNSLEKAYFAGDSVVEGLEFLTETLVSTATLLTAGRLSASGTAFQSKGLL